MAGIVQQLFHTDPKSVSARMLGDAGREIERLRAENEKLRDELLHWKYTETEMTDTIIARIMWDAYAAQAGGKTFDGKPLPTWEELGEERQACWLAAASAAAAAIREGERDV